MRTILLSMLWCSFALAGPLEDLDRTRITELPEDEGAASAQLRAWSDAIARADTSLHNKAAREVVAVEKGLYAIAYKGYLGVVACKKSDGECDAALAAVKDQSDAFATVNRETRLWSPYASTFQALSSNMRTAGETARRARVAAEKKSAQTAAEQRVADAVTARDAAFAAAGPDADEATLRDAVAKAADVHAACDAMASLHGSLPTACLNWTRSAPYVLALSTIINRLPASPEFSNGSRCPNGCFGPLADAAVLTNFEWGAMDAAPKVRALFESVHPSRYYFLTRDVREDRALVANRGEVVLIKADVVNAERVRVVTLDNRHLEVAPTFLTNKPIKGSKLLATRPNEFTLVRKLDGKDVVVGSMWDSEVDDEAPEGEPPFLRLMDPGSRDYEQFVKASDAFVACFDKQMKRLDPDGTAWRYDRETYSTRTGATLKVENYAAALKRQACGTCGCRKFNATRAALANKVLAPLRKEIAATYAESVARIGKRLAN